MNDDQTSRREGGPHRGLAMAGVVCGLMLVLLPTGNVARAQGLPGLTGVKASSQEQAGGKPDEAKDMFQRAFDTFKEGESMELQGSEHWAGARKDYQKVDKILAELQQRYPQWQPDVVAYRRQMVADALVKLPVAPVTPAVSNEPDAAVKEGQTPRAATEGRMKQLEWIKAHGFKQTTGAWMLVVFLAWAIFGLVPLLAWLVWRGKVFPERLRCRAFWTRVWAFLLDWLLLYPLTVCLLWIGRRTGSWVARVSMDQLSFDLNWLYLVVMHARYGQTLGKMVFKLKVVDAKTGGAISVWQALVRESLWWLLPGLRLGITGIGWTGVIWCWADVLAPSFNARQRALHDLAAGTVVVRTNISDEIAEAAASAVTGKDDEPADTSYDY